MSASPLHLIGVAILLCGAAGACAGNPVPTVPAEYKAVQPVVLCTPATVIAPRIRTQVELQASCPGKTVDFERSTVVIVGGDNPNYHHTETLWWAVDRRTGSIVIGQRRTEECPGGVEMPLTPLVAYEVPGKEAHVETKVETVRRARPCGPARP